MGRAWVVIGVAAIVAVVVASAAAAGQATSFVIEVEEDGIVLEDFCDISGLDVDLSFEMEIRVQIVPHGRDGLEYFLQHGTRREVLSANGMSLTSVANVIEKDMRVTDLGGGSVKVLILATGNAVLYDASGKAIARNPGQIWFEIVFDADGNEISREIVTPSTGRSDDFCDAALAALS